MEQYNRWEVIRTYYQNNEDRIIEAAKNGRWLDPYVIDWVPNEWNRSPPEYWVWESLRTHGREGKIPMTFYPQYPILNYFADFADPWKKIVIEVDGKRWHNAEKDALRDKKMRDEGWKIMRIPARMAYCRVVTPWIEFQDKNLLNTKYEIGQWVRETTDGLILALRIICYENWKEEGIEEQYELSWGLPEGTGNFLINTCNEVIHQYLR